MKVLIVDDQNDKVVNICAALKEVGVEAGGVSVVTTAAAALDLLRREYFDLMILDIYLPNRIGEPPAIDGGVRLLRRMHRGDDIRAPEAIFGLTASAEAFQAAVDDFRNHSWALEEVAAGSAVWKIRLLEKVQYIRARREAAELASIDNSKYRKPRCDVLFVCALLEPELSELQLASGSVWSPEVFLGDPGVYWKSTLAYGEATFEAYAVSLPQMGLVAAAAAVAKSIMVLSPRLVVMTGICAGRRGDCDLGDVIGANITWDYGSGKFSGVEGNVVFEAAPFQTVAPAKVSGVMSRMLSQHELIEKFYREAPGYRPTTVPRFRIGPIGSGAAVQNHPEFFSGVAQQQRKIIGVDMEAFAVAWACHEAVEPQPLWLVLKSVVDFADGTKNSELQKFGSYLSARFALWCVPLLLDQ